MQILQGLPFCGTVNLLLRAALYKARMSDGMPEDKDLPDSISTEFHKNARIIGNEIAWRGDDIKSVLEQMGRAGVAILGLESVRYRHGKGPYVESISDASSDVRKWQTSEPWERCIALSIERSIFDIERTVKNPYGDDVWYFVVEKSKPKHELA